MLLGAHDKTGAQGWVLNGKPLLTAKKLLEDADLVPPGITLPDTLAFHTPVRVGGPVMPGSAWILYKQGNTATPAFAGEHVLGNGYFVTGAREAIEALARAEGPEEFRMFLGYAGWGEEQLEGEIARGGWLPHDVLPELLFDVAADALWDQAYQRAVGAPPMAFTGTVRGQA